VCELSADERSKRAVEAIAQQAEHSSGIVDPKALAAVSVGLVEHRFAKAGVRLIMSSVDELPRIACEPRLMPQVLVNLLLNACDVCESGGHVELRLIAEGQSVAFVVTDDGSGISSDAAARIMDPFFTTKPAGEGSGLGLAIANELVKHHRGTLTVAARQGHHGTRACVELPAATGPSNA
jgi:two-component system NtrC family sensor kinase